MRECPDFNLTDNSCLHPKKNWLLTEQKTYAILRITAYDCMNRASDVEAGESPQTSCHHARCCPSSGGITEYGLTGAERHRRHDSDRRGDTPAGAGSGSVARLFSQFARWQPARAEDEDAGDDDRRHWQPVLSSDGAGCAGCRACTPLRCDDCQYRPYLCGGAVVCRVGDPASGRRCDSGALPHGQGRF